jgi:hypothetical protein
MRTVGLWLLGSILAMTATIPAASEPATGGDAQRFVGVWRLVSITEGGRVNPLRGARPTGYIFYTASGEMGAMIQPDRAPVAMAGKTPSGPEAQAALRGYTAYFGTYIVDERAKVVTHVRKASVQPGFEMDAPRWYRFEDNRLLLGGLTSKSQLVWERTK